MGLRWTVSRDTALELAEVFRENGIPENAPLVGIDASHFCGQFGLDWLKALVTAVRSRGRGQPYLYLDDESDQALATWVQRAGIPTVSALSPPLVLALISYSTSVISGKSTFFELAQLVHRPTVGVFSGSEMARYCRISNTCIGVPYRTRPDSNAIDQVCDAMDELTR
jgi:hypothetical protein